MRDFFWKTVVWAGVLLTGCMQVNAQSSYLFTDPYTAATYTVTNSLGTASVSNGMVVFEGQLDSDIVVNKAYNGTTGLYLASLQLLAQIKLFDVLPDTNDVGTVQGAVAALRDAPGSSNGVFYVWAVSNSTPTWVQLMQTNGAPFAVADGATNYITFVFNYGTPSNSYQVFVGTTPGVQYPSESVTSPSAITSGITGVSMLGVGSLGVDTLATASGAPGPLSSSIGFSVYATSKGVLLILDTVNEKGTGWLVVKALIDGVWVEVGRVQADGSNHYEIPASAALVVGQSYVFKVIDELGNEHLLSQPVEVKTIKMDSIVMIANVMFVTFNSEPGKSYQVLVAESPTAAVWTPAVVYYPTQEGWGYNSSPFTAASTSTTIKIPRGENGNPANKGFFKIIRSSAQ